MRKFAASALLIASIICFSSCNEVEQSYKKVSFYHPDILCKELILTIPSHWSTEELCQDNALLEIYNDGSKMGDISINTNYDGEKTIYKIRKKLIPVKNAKFKRISDHCFISTNQEKERIISYLIGDKVIDILLNDSIDKNTVKIIAENIAYLDFKIKQELSSDENLSKKPDIVIDTAFLDDENSIDQPKTYNQAYSVFLSIDSLSEIIRKPGANLIGSSSEFRSMYLAIDVDDGFFYYVIEDYLLKELIFAKSEQSTNQANSNNYKIIDRKPFSLSTNLVNTWDAYIMKNGFSNSMVTIEIIDKMVERANLYSFIHDRTIQPDSYEISDNKVAITVRLYCPTLKAYFHVTENYETRETYFGLGGVNYEDNVPMEYWKYNTSKPLSSNAKKENFKSIGGLF
ncbi:MAG: hypothetical protein PHI32_06660 [Dysgonamonadaceae bacterium]|nr:hypothetical protein [Dysgonamonadaceae bacterium]